MSPEEASKQIIAAMNVTREDVARAKNWLQRVEVGNTHEMVDRWLNEQKLVIPRHIDTDLTNCGDLLLPIARAYSARLAFYKAVWELVSIGELIQAGPPMSWNASLESKTSRYGGEIPLKSLQCSFPQAVERMPFYAIPSADPDIFLDGTCCGAMHAGILEAIAQALECFRRGLYMPATAMLAAAAEAAWTECGAAIAKKIASTKLEAVISDQLSSLSKKVTEIQKAVEQPDGKLLLKAAGVTIPKVNDAEVWTTALRERRNALHWGKAKSFVADQVRRARFSWPHHSTSVH